MAGEAKETNPQSSQKPTEGGSRIQPQSAQLPMDDQTRVLWCLVAGPGHPSTFKINVKITHDVDDLKTLIYEERKHGVLRNVGAIDLVLWKV